MRIPIEWKIKLIRLLGSGKFFAVCLFIFFVGLILTISWSFKVEEKKQREILQEVIQSQQETIKNREIGANNNQKVREELAVVKEQVLLLTKSNEELIRTVCSLQRQLESAGITPIVPRNDDTCPGI